MRSLHSSPSAALAAHVRATLDAGGSGAALRVRALEDHDAPALQALIGGVFAEYAGCVLDLPGIDADLAAPATAASRTRGAVVGLFLAGDGGGEGALVASVGYAPAGVERDTVELKRLYVGAPHRRRGLGVALTAAVERAAAESGARRVTLWTDTRFLRAHRLYERLGYVRQPWRRALGDPSRSIELNYERALGAARPVEAP